MGKKEFNAEGFKQAVMNSRIIQEIIQRDNLNLGKFADKVTEFFKREQRLMTLKDLNKIREELLKEQQ